MDVTNMPSSFGLPQPDKRGAKRKDSGEREDADPKQHKISEVLSQRIRQSTPAKTPKIRNITPKKPPNVSKIKQAVHGVSDSRAKQKLFTSNEPENRGVFLCTNERGSKEVIDALRLLPARGNVGMGVSGLYNLELFLARSDQGIQYWIVSDPAPEVQAFWFAMQGAFLSAQSLDDVFQKVHSEIIAAPSLFFTKRFMENNGWTNENFSQIIARDLQECKNRLETSSSYDFHKLQSLVIHGLIIQSLDLVNPDEVQSIQRAMQEKGLVLDTLYTSNVGLVIPEESLATMDQNVASLRSTQQAYLIDALPKTSHGYLPAYDPMAKIAAHVEQRLTL